MNVRKRPSQDGILSVYQKRPRSLIFFKKNAAWGSSTESLRRYHGEEFISRAAEDHGLEEAVAALLAIGCDSDGIEKSRLRPKEALVGAEKPLLFKSEQTTVISPIKIEVEIESPEEFLGHADRLPSTSSGSDVSLTAVMPLTLDPGSGRSSFDSNRAAPQPRIIHQASVHLLKKEPLEVRVSSPILNGSVCSLSQRPPSLQTGRSSPSPQLLQPASQHGQADILGGASLDLASVGISQAPLLQANSTARTSKMAPDSKASAGVSKKQGTGLSSSSRVRPVASFSGGRLIVIAPAPSDAGPDRELQPSAPLPSSAAVEERKDSKNPRLLTLPRAAETLGSGRQAVACTRRTADKPLWQNASSNCGKAAGTSSGDESSDDQWQSTWGLDLFSVLNPSVITTGHCTFRESS